MEPIPIDLVDIQDIETDAISSGIGHSMPAARTTLNPVSLADVPDGDYLPLVRVQPQYPRRAQQRGIEGSITVSLTVNADGTVSADTIQVIDEDPKGYFVKAAKKAAAKFKYKPKMVNGVGQKVEGVIYKFSFNLAD